MKGFGHALAYRAEGSAERGSKHAAHRPTPWAQSFLDEAKRPETWKGEKQDPPGAGTPSRPPPVVLIEALRDSPYCPSTHVIGEEWAGKTRLRGGQKQATGNSAMLAAEDDLRMNAWCSILPP
jgi:hypothetical protein